MPYPAEQINYMCIGSGPPALMIHGNPATMSLWRPLAERLAAVRTIYLIDLPGFGGTPAAAARDAYSLPELAETLRAFADHHGLERFDLVGHSFGGAIAIALAAAVPERIRTLTAITPLTDHIPPLARLGRSMLLQQAISALWRAAPGAMRRLFIRNWARISYGTGYSPERAREVAREADRPDLVRSAGTLAAGMDYARYGEVLARLGMCGTPLLLVGAGRDRVIPHEHFRDLHVRLAHATVHTFVESGHVPMWQYPEELAELMREFWERET